MSYVQRRRFLWILFVAGIALAAVVAKATTLAPMSFDRLAQQSVAVGRLRCVSAESHWEAGEIWTVSRFEVVELEKGALSGMVSVRMLGGRVGGLSSRVDGVPTFRAGEEVYLFLWGMPGEPYRVLGWSQGTFRIARDPRSGLENVTQESASANFDAHTRQFQSKGIRSMPVPRFREKLRQALAVRVAAQN